MHVLGSTWTRVHIRFQFTLSHAVARTRVTHIHIFIAYGSEILIQHTTRVRILYSYLESTPPPLNSTHNKCTQQWLLNVKVSLWQRATTFPNMNILAYINKCGHTYRRLLQVKPDGNNNDDDESSPSSSLQSLWYEWSMNIVSK